MQSTMTSPIYSRTSMRRLAPIAPIACALLGGSAWAHSVDEELAAAGSAGADARSLLQAFRESGEDRYLDEAWRLVEGELDSGASASLLIEAALIAQARHRFDEARRLISRALSLEPGNDQGWMLVNAISLVQHRVEEAANACRRLRHSPPLAIVTCHARVALATGKEASVAPRLDALLELGSMDDSLLAWSHSVAADLAASQFPG